MEVMVKITCHACFLDKKQISVITKQKPAGNQCDPPCWYYCLLLLGIVQHPPLMMHPWLQWFSSKLAKTQAGSLDTTKDPRILNRTGSRIRAKETSQVEIASSGPKVKRLRNTARGTCFSFSERLMKETLYKWTLVEHKDAEGLYDTQQIRWFCTEGVRYGNICSLCNVFHNCFSNRAYQFLPVSLFSFGPFPPHWGEWDFVSHHKTIFPPSTVIP